MGCIDIMSDIVKRLGIYYSYNEKLEIQENFKRHSRNIKKFLRIWRMRDLSIACKITVIKTVAILKIVHLALVKTNSKFNYTRIKQNSKRIYMENSQSYNKT